MSDPKNSNRLKDQLIAQNDQQYGAEVRQRWGKEAWQKSNRLFRNLTQDQFDQLQELDKEFKSVLARAFETNDPKGELAQKAVGLHRQWLAITWPEYSKEAHLGLAAMYVKDVRFHHYFNDNPALAQFFLSAVSSS